MEIQLWCCKTYRDQCIIVDMHSYNNLYTCGDQFFIETYYHPYRDFKPFLERDSSTDYSYESSSFGAHQYPLWQDAEAASHIKHRTFKNHEIETSEEFVKAFNKLTKWTAKKLKENYRDVEIVPATSWIMDYEEGSWQSVHSHGLNVITQVLHMDGSHLIDPEVDPKMYACGSTFVFMTDGNPPFYKAVRPSAGKCLIMPGDVFHGAYPVRELPRRCVVVDYLVLK